MTAVKDHESTADVKVGFDRLPLPPVPEDFSLPGSLKVAVRRYLNRPSPYVHIRRSIYLVKKPRKKSEEENMQCSCLASETSTGTCDRDCLCGMLLTSCSTSCKCGDTCTNLPFQKRPGRKLKAVKTQQCGWGLKAEEDIRAGDFLVEYVGEVIDDETCEKRLWKMKEQGESNFYMCEISREMVIDATFKGNLSRFINHSCSPNSELQKWEIEGEIRIGVFAKVNIKKGEFVSYDYQFIQFGTDQFCHCGASDCRGQLGKPQKQKVSAEVAMDTITGRPLLTRRSKRSKLYGSFSIGRTFTPINGVFRHQKNSFGEDLEGGVVQADVHYHQHARRDSCVGLRVKVWWPLDQKFYHGKIVRYDPKIGKHQIMYDDGQEEDLLMTKERWEVEKTLPSQRKRGQSPESEQTTSGSPVLNQKRDHPLVLKRKRGQSPALEQKTGQSHVLGQKRGHAIVLERKRVQSPVSKQGIGQSPELGRKRGHSLVLEVNRCQSRVMGLKGGHSSVLQYKRGRTPVLERMGGQLPVFKRGHSQVLEKERGEIPALERKKGQSAELEQKSAHLPLLEWTRADSPRLERRNLSPRLEYVRCQSRALEQKSDQRPISERTSGHAPRLEQKRDLSPVLEQERGQSPRLEQSRGETPEMVPNRSGSPVLREKSQSPDSPVMQQERGNSLVIFKYYTRQRFSKRVENKSNKD